MATESTGSKTRAPAGVLILSSKLCETLERRSVPLVAHHDQATDDHSDVPKTAPCLSGSAVLLPMIPEEDKDDTPVALAESQVDCYTKLPSSDDPECYV
jgi:hypothetical protein